MSDAERELKEKLREKLLQTINDGLRKFDFKEFSKLGSDELDGALIDVFANCVFHMTIKMYDRDEAYMFLDSLKQQLADNLGRILGDAKNRTIN